MKIPVSKSACYQLYFAQARIRIAIDADELRNARDSLSVSLPYLCGPAVVRRTRSGARLCESQQADRVFAA
jgi:hypothetical protein